MASDMDVECEALVASIGSPKSREATDALFFATGADLAKTFRLGRTGLLEQKELLGLMSESKIQP